MVRQNQNMKIQLFYKSFDFSVEPKRGRNPWEVRQNLRTLTIKWFWHFGFCIMRISFLLLRRIFGGSTFLIVKGVDYNGFGWRSC